MPDIFAPVAQVDAAAEDEANGLDRAEPGMEAYPEFGRGSQTI